MKNLFIVETINPLGESFLSVFETKEEAVEYADGLDPNFDALVYEYTRC